jgi:hypothetical protein
LLANFAVFFCEPFLVWITWFWAMN